MRDPKDPLLQKHLPPVAEIPLCEVCNIKPVICRIRDKSKPHLITFRRTCYKCRSRPWKQYKEDKCSKCGFIPEHSCQLDVDHIDGDRFNNDPNNFQTLCANCHRLKTHLNRPKERCHADVEVKRDAPGVEFVEE